ncbi:MAG: ribonuclease P protein subunit [Methanobacteriota archaeon]|nr:MAG: ribonuclease P protein subunit [Euryarchaeota archaeon]
MKSKDFRRTQFIGLDVEVIGSTCPSIVGVHGRVVDETKNTITIEQDGVEKMVAKAGCEFRFDDGSQAHVVSGDDIRFRPEDRIKRVR